MIPPLTPFCLGFVRTMVGKRGISSLGLCSLNPLVRNLYCQMSQKADGRRKVQRRRKKSRVQEDPGRKQGSFSFQLMPSLAGGHTTSPSSCRAPSSRQAWSGTDPRRTKPCSASPLQSWGERLSCTGAGNGGTERSNGLSKITQ